MPIMSSVRPSLEPVSRLARARSAQRRRGLAISGLLVLLVGCLEGGIVGRADADPDVDRLFIGVEGGLLTTVIGGTLQLRPYGFDEMDNSIDVGPATWRSLDTNIATVSSAGVVRGRSVGNVLIQGEASGKSDDVPIQVRSAWCGP